MSPPVITVDIWSDVICPWCYIGKRRFERATAGMDITTTWRSFELAPNAPAHREGGYAERLARKYGMDIDMAMRRVNGITEQAAAEGLAYRLDIAQPGNTFDAHRILHYAKEQGAQDACKERFLAAYLTEGVAIGLPENLVTLSTQVGLSQGEVEDILAGDRYADAVRADEALAMDLGISAVPSFLVQVGDRRAVIPGAQDSESMRLMIERVAARAAEAARVDSP